MKRFYAVENDYGSKSSFGFANTWSVYVFESKQTRNAWVKSRDTLTAKAITLSEVTTYAANEFYGESDAPRPFSGEFWCVLALEYTNNTVADPNKGCIGTVQNSRHTNCEKRLFKKSVSQSTSANKTINWSR